MLRKDFILCKTRNLLNEFMAPVITNADKAGQLYIVGTRIKPLKNG